IGVRSITPLHARISATDVNPSEVQSCCSLRFRRRRAIHRPTSWTSALFSSEALVLVHMRFSCLRAVLGFSPSLLGFFSIASISIVTPM
ncbi:hypothetical protein A4X13_0g9490, partial [Tilletia indica]